MEEEEVGPDSLVDEEASSKSRGIGGGGSGQAAVSGGTGFLILPQTLAFLWLLTFLWLLFVYRSGGGGRTRLFGR